MSKPIICDRCLEEIREADLCNKPKYYFSYVCIDCDEHEVWQEECHGFPTYVS